MKISMCRNGCAYEYRPFENCKEFVESVSLHFDVHDYLYLDDFNVDLPCIWVRSRCDKFKYLITGYGNNELIVGNNKVNLEELLEYYELLDGEPCGVEVGIVEVNE